MLTLSALMCAVCLVCDVISWKWALVLHEESRGRVLCSDATFAAAMIAQLVLSSASASASASSTASSKSVQSSSESGALDKAQTILGDAHARGFLQAGMGHRALVGTMHTHLNSWKHISCSWCVIEGLVEEPVVT